MPGMMVPVHRFACYEIAPQLEGEVNAAPATAPLPAQAPPLPDPIPVTDGQLVQLLNVLSGNARLGPVHVLAEGVLVIGELTGFAHVELDQAIIPAVMAPRSGRA